MISRRSVFRRVSVLCLAASLLAATAWMTTREAVPPPPERDGSVVRLRRGELLYRYNATFRAEALFLWRDDPLESRDLALERPRDLERLRGEFLGYYTGARTLADIPLEKQDWRATLESMGYLGGGSDAEDAEDER